MLADLSYVDYRKILDSYGPGKLKVLIQKGREIALLNKSANSKGSDVEGSKSKGLEVKDSKSEAEELIDPMELAYLQEREFFFGKDKDNDTCKCGAAYTSFPDYHSHFCSLYYKTVLKYNKG